MKFSHDGLNVYKKSIEFVALTDSIIKSLPKGRSHIADQLHRAGTSIPLNIAEGSGEYLINEKNRFYRMAKRSATECAAILDICKELQLVADTNYSRGRELLFNIVSMLTKLAQKSA